MFQLYFYILIWYNFPYKSPNSTIVIWATGFHSGSPFLFIPYYILCYLVFIFFSINTIEKFHILIILSYQTIHTIEIYEPQSLNHHSHIGIFNFTNVFGLSVKYLLSMYNRYRGFESLNVPQVFAFQDLSLFISVLNLVIYNTPYTPLLKCSRISPT